MYLPEKSPPTPITPLQAIAHLPHCTSKTKAEFAKLFKAMELKKGHLLINPNQLNTSVYFISSGLLHQYRKVEDHIQTIRFYSTPSFLGQTGSYQNQLIPDYVSALTKCTLYSATHRQILQLCHHNPQAIRIIVLLQEQLLKETTELISCLHLQPAIKRYHALAKILGKNIYLIPKHHLASYLTMSRKHLSRLNSQILRDKI